MVLPPTEQVRHSLGGYVVALSPDGKHLVYATNQQLYLRAMDELEATPIRGTRGAGVPFFSPDSEWVGFWAGGQLKKVSLRGEAPVALCDAQNPYGASWGANDRIVFDQEGIWQISAAGGRKEVLISPDSTKGELHRFPQMLPGGKAVLFTLNLGTAWSDAKIVVQSLETGERKVLISGGKAARYVPTGHLVFARWGTLLAVPFDLVLLEVTGDAVPMVEGLTASSQFTFSSLGSLVYVPNVSDEIERRLVWFDRGGKRLGSVGEPEQYGQIVLSPDEKRVAINLLDPDQIELLELSSGISSQFTFDPSGASDPIWSPDSNWVAFASYRKGVDIFQKVVGGGEEEVLFESDDNQWPVDWSPDGRFILSTRDGKTVYALPLFDDRKPKLLLETHFDIHGVHLSPNGQWIAYHSNESGSWEVYVASFPAFTDKRRVSNAGGCQARWRKDRKELFYLGLGGKLMVVEVKGGAPLETGIPKVLFQMPVRVNAIGIQYCVSGDGQRFLVLEPTEETPQRIDVVLNWFEELQQLVPTE